MFYYREARVRASVNILVLDVEPLATFDDTQITIFTLRKSSLRWIEEILEAWLAVRFPLSFKTTV